MKLSRILKAVGLVRLTATSTLLGARGRRCQVNKFNSDLVDGLDGPTINITDSALVGAIAGEYQGQ